MLKNKITFSRSAAAVIVDDIMYYITVALMMLSGVGPYGHERRLRTAKSCVMCSSGVTIGNDRDVGRKCFL
jgi:hypothetical protein